MSKRRNSLAPTMDDLLTSFRLDHQASNARLEDLDQAAVEADMSHDVEQAATDSDVVAALTDVDPDTNWLDSLSDCQPGERPVDAPAAFNRMLDPLPEYPAFLYYDPRQGGVVWAGSPTAYPIYLEAALARDGK